MSEKEPIDFEEAKKGRETVFFNSDNGDKQYGETELNEILYGKKTQRKNNGEIDLITDHFESNKDTGNKEIIGDVGDVKTKNKKRKEPVDPNKVTGALDVIDRYNKIGTEEERRKKKEIADRDKLMDDVNKAQADKEKLKNVPSKEPAKYKGKGVKIKIAAILAAGSMVIGAAGIGIANNINNKNGSENRGIITSIQESANEETDIKGAIISTSERESLNKNEKPEVELEEKATEEEFSLAPNEKFTEISDAHLEEIKKKIALENGIKETNNIEVLGFRQENGDLIIRVSNNGFRIEVGQEIEDEAIDYIVNSYNREDAEDLTYDEYLNEYSKYETIAEQNYSEQEKQEQGKPVADLPPAELDDEER